MDSISPKIVAAMFRRRKATVTEWIGSGADPADKTNELSDDYTTIPNDPAAIAGNVTVIQIYCESTGNIEFAVFSKSGVNFTDKGSVSLVVGSSGLVEFSIANGDWSLNDLTIEIGEYVGYYATDWVRLNIDTVPGPGYWRDSGDQIGSLAATQYQQMAAPGEVQMRMKIEG